MKNPWLKLSGIGLAAMLGLGGPAVALAGSSADTANERFKAIDTNGDGKISEAEFEAAAVVRFEAMDTSHDDRVTAMEIDAYKRSTTGKEKKTAKGWDTTYTSSGTIKDLDTDGDGYITVAEYEAGAKVKFEELDTNHDGFLSKSEWDAGFKRFKTTGT